MCQKTLKLRINNIYLSMIDNIISMLGNIIYVATTTDCRSKGYLGVTYHWINSNSLQRHSVYLACSHIRGEHTYDVVASALYKIHATFKIQNKIVAYNNRQWFKFYESFQIVSDFKKFR